MLEDEFIRPPRWALVVWDSADVQRPTVRYVILVTPIEADFSLRCLREPSARGCSLHRFAPRIRRDQRELLTSGLTSWATCGPVVQNGLDGHLHFAVMALSLFGVSTCLQNNNALLRSIRNVFYYLGVIPSPSAFSGGVDPSDWRLLVDAKLIQLDGFVASEEREDEPQRPANLSDACWNLFLETRKSHQWTSSPVEAVRGLVSIRRMEPWFEKSDLSSVLLLK